LSCSSSEILHRNTRLNISESASLAVLAYNEIPENRRIRVIAAVGR